MASSFMPSTIALSSNSEATSLSISLVFIYVFIFVGLFLIVTIVSLYFCISKQKSQKISSCFSGRHYKYLSGTKNESPSSVCSLKDRKTSSTDNEGNLLTLPSPNSHGNTEISKSFFISGFTKMTPIQGPPSPTSPYASMPVENVLSLSFTELDEEFENIGLKTASLVRSYSSNSSSWKNTSNAENNQGYFNYLREKVVGDKRHVGLNLDSAQLERLAVEKEHDTKKVDHYSRLGKSTVNAHTIVQLSARTSKDKDKDIETTAV